MDWAANDLAERDLYKLLVNTVLPRPIALVTTVDAQGRANAAPFSFFNVFSHAPPLVVLGIEGRSGGAPLKDTMRNIRETGSFVVNLVDRAMVEAMQICAIDFPGEVDEIAAAGLDTAPSAAITAPARTDEIRQPVGVNPNTRIPPAISHFPSGGCTARPDSAPHCSKSTASAA